MTDGSFASILKQAASNPVASFPGLGLEARFLKRFKESDLPEGSRLVLNGSGKFSLSIPSSSDTGILPGHYAGQASSAEVEEWIRQLRESGIESHSEESGDAGDVAVSVVSATDVFRFSSRYTDSAFLNFRSALESVAAQALKAPQWAISLSVRSDSQHGNSGTDLMLAFSNPGDRGVWIDSPARPLALEDAPVCELEFARKPQIVPVVELERLKRSRLAVNPAEAGAPLLWIGPRTTVSMKVKAAIPAHEIILARLIYRSESGQGIIPGIPRFIGTLVSPVFEVRT
jgi:hypothetical protein